MSPPSIVHFLALFILSGNIMENIFGIIFQIFVIFAVSGTLRIDTGVDVSEINPCKVKSYY